MNKSTFNRLAARQAYVTTGLTAVGLLVSPIAAKAQSLPQSAAEQTESGGLEEIIVTAQRRSENLQKVPIAVTAVTATSLVASGTNSILQLEKVAPGLIVYQVAGSSLPFIRGVGSSQSAPGFESPIALYIDGVYQGSKNANVFDLGNIERIEVLKGPQGTLFGRNATGGAISIITADPDGAPFINAEGGFGRFNEKRAKLYAGGSITDTLSAGVAFSGRWDDGFIYNRFLDQKQNPAKNMVVLGKLVWKPSDRFTAKLSGSYSYYSDPTVLSPHVLAGTVPVAGGTPNFGPSYDKYEITLDHPTRVEIAAQRYTLNMKYDVGGPSLVSITGYIKGGAHSVSDSDMSSARLQYSGAGQPFKQFSQELQIQSAPGRFTYIGGLYYMYLKEGFGEPGDGNAISATNVPSPVRPEDLGPSFGGLGPANASTVGISTHIISNAYAAFAQATYEIFDDTHFTAGLRYNTEKKKLVGNIYFYTAVPGATNQNIPLFNGALSGNGLVFGTREFGTVNLSKTFSKPTFRISLDHQFTPDILAYASFNRGFKSGTYNSQTVNNTQQVVRPESIDAYEIGFKSEWFDNRVRLNAAAFYYNYSDIQVGLITGVGVTTVQNAAGARVYGLDADLTASVTNAFTLRAGMSLINSKYQDYTNAQVFLPKIVAGACPTNPTVTLAQAKGIGGTTPPAGVGGNCSYALNASGQDLIFAPKWSANLGGDYNLVLGDARILLSGSIYFNGGFDVVPAGINGHVGSYESANGSITYYGRDDRYFVRLWGENLTNDHHSTYISPQATGYQEVNARPITYGVTVGFKM